MTAMLERPITPGHVAPSNPAPAQLSPLRRASLYALTAGITVAMLPVTSVVWVESRLRRR